MATGKTVRPATQIHQNSLSITGAAHAPPEGIDGYQSNFVAPNRRSIDDVRFPAATSSSLVPVTRGDNSRNPRDTNNLLFQAGSFDKNRNCGSRTGFASHEDWAMSPFSSRHNLSQTSQALRPIAWPLVCCLMLCQPLAFTVAAPDNSQETPASRPVHWPAGFRTRQGSTSWQGQTLRRALQVLTATEEVTLLLDRRIDPDQTIDGTFAGSLDERLAALATQLDVGISVIGQVVYLGPATVTRRLATMVELKRAEVRKHAPELARRLARSQPFSWEDLDTPRSLVAKLCQEAEIDTANLDQIPHDLWAGNQLPALPISHRLTLLLAGFDLTYKYDKARDRLEFTPLPLSPAITRRYTLRGKSALVAQLKRRFPDIRLSGPTMVGPLEAHQQLRLWLTGRKPAAPRPGPLDAQQIIFQKLTLRNVTATQALQALCRQAKWTLHFDPEVGEQRQSLVNLVGEQVPLPQALNDLLKQAGLQAQRKGQQLHVRLRGDSDTADAANR